MDPTFWQQGICFECQGTGKCCTQRGEYGYIYVTLEDRRRLASHLEVSPAQFARRYCARTDGLYHLLDPELDCGFLQEGRCQVYPARPTQCRTWPFWPENMDSRVWEQEVTRFCKGAGKGRRYSAKEIEALLRLDPDCPEDLG